MLEVGRAYTTISGEQRFLILAKKRQPASNGCNYIGENVKTGTIAYFNHRGENAFSKELRLQCDPYTWVGLVHFSKIANPEFVRREELKGKYTGYLRMEARDPTTIKFVDQAGFELTYV